MKRVITFQSALKIQYVCKFISEYKIYAENTNPQRDLPRCVRKRGFTESFGEFQKLLHYLIHKIR